MHDHLHDVREAISKVQALIPHLQNADMSKWEPGKDGVIDLPRLRQDPGWCAMRDIDGLISLLLARFEITLQQLCQSKDSEKSMTRFLEFMTNGAKPDGYFTDGSLAAGVVDTGVDLELVTPSEAATLKLERPWRSSFSLSDCTDYVQRIVSTTEAIINRAE